MHLLRSTDGRLTLRNDLSLRETKIPRFSLLSINLDEALTRRNMVWNECKMCKRDNRQRTDPVYELDERGKE
jgi:hypothetical protein